MIVMDTDTKQVAVILTTGEHDELRRIARQDGRSVANMARWIILQQLAAATPEQPSA